MSMSYVDLFEILFETLELNLENYAMWIKYAFELGCAPVKIVNDHYVKFYLKLKNNEHDKTKFPLCVGTMGKPMSMTNQGTSVEVSNSRNVCKSKSAYFHGKRSLS